jgi:hypothetical protein
MEVWKAGKGTEEKRTNERNEGREKTKERKRREAQVR